MAVDNWTPVEIMDFSGGARRDKSPVQLADNELRYAMNALLDERGAIRKRPGTSKLDSAAIASGVTGVDNLFRFYTSSGDYLVISCFTTAYTKIYSYNGSVYTEITGGSALAAGTHVEFAAYGDYLFISNGSVFQYWTGAGAKADCGYKAGSVSVVPRLMVIADDRLFAVTGTAGERFTIFFTEIGVYDTDPTDINFAVGYDLDVPNRPSDGNGINALSVFQEELLAFCDSQVYELVGNDDTDYALVTRSRAAGCVSARGAIEAEDSLVFFIGNGQEYTYDGGRITPIGDAIMPSVQPFTLENAVAVYVPQWRSVLFSHANGTHVWHIPSGLRGAYSTKAFWDIGGWTEFSVKMSAVCRYTKRGEKNQIVFGKPDSAYLYKFDDSTYQDDGSNYLFLVQTKTYTMGQFMSSYESRQIRLLLGTDREEPCTVGITRLCKDDGTKVAEVTATVRVDGPLWDVVYWDQFMWADDAVAIATADHPFGFTGSAFSAYVKTEDQYALTVYGLGFSMKPKERD